MELVQWFDRSIVVFSYLFFIGLFMFGLLNLFGFKCAKVKTHLVFIVSGSAIFMFFWFMISHIFEM